MSRQPRIPSVFWPAAARRPRLTSDPSHNSFALYRLVSPMSSDGWTLRKDHRDALARLSAPRPPHRPFDPAVDHLAELDQDVAPSLNF